MSQAKKILVVGPAWVGDMVMAQSLFIALKKKIPGCQIDVLAPDWTFSLLERMPEVSERISMPVGRGQFGLIQRYQSGRKLSQVGYQHAIVLPNSWKSALIPFFAKISLRTGYIGEMRWGLLNDARTLDKSVLVMTVQRFVALADQRGVKFSPECPSPVLHVSQRTVAKTVEKFNLATEKKVLALCPGAEYGPAKRWPTAHFAEVARQKIADGWQVWLFGSEKDKTIAAEINQKADSHCHDFSGLTTMAEVIDLMSLAKIVISNDSGLMHVAAALDKKLVAIYGSSDPKFTPPLNKKAIIISLGLSCSPCFDRECSLGHYHCLTGITAQQVLSAME